MNENSIANKSNENKITSPYILEFEYEDGTKRIGPYVPIANINKIKCGNKNIFYNTDTMCMMKRPLQDFLSPDQNHGQGAHPLASEEKEKIKKQQEQIFGLSGLPTNMFMILNDLFGMCSDSKFYASGYSFSTLITHIISVLNTDTIKLSNSCFVGKGDTDIFDLRSFWRDRINANTIAKFVEGTDYKLNSFLESVVELAEDSEPMSEEMLEYYKVPTWIRRNDKNCDSFKLNIRKYFNLDCCKYTADDFNFIKVEDIPQKLFKINVGGTEYFSLKDKKGFCTAAEEIIKSIMGSEMFRSANLNLKKSDLETFLNEFQVGYCDPDIGMCVYGVGDADDFLEGIRQFLRGKFNDAFKNSNLEISGELINEARDFVEVYIWQSIIEAIARRYQNESLQIRNQIIKNYKREYERFHESNFKIDENETNGSRIESLIKKIIGNSMKLNANELCELKESVLSILDYLAPQLNCTQVFSYEFKKDHEIDPRILIAPNGHLVVSIKFLFDVFAKYYSLESSINAEILKYLRNSSSFMFICLLDIPDDYDKKIKSVKKYEFCDDGPDFKYITADGLYKFIVRELEKEVSEFLDNREAFEGYLFYLFDLIVELKSKSKELIRAFLKAVTSVGPEFYNKMIAGIAEKPTSQLVEDACDDDKLKETIADIEKGLGKEITNIKGTKSYKEASEKDKLLLEEELVDIQENMIKLEAIKIIYRGFYLCPDDVARNNGGPLFTFESTILLANSIQKRIKSVFKNRDHGYILSLIEEDAKAADFFSPEILFDIIDNSNVKKYLSGLNTKDNKSRMELFIDYLRSGYFLGLERDDLLFELLSLNPLFLNIFFEKENNLYLVNLAGFKKYIAGLDLKKNTEVIDFICSGVKKISNAETKDQVINVLLEQNSKCFSSLQKTITINSNSQKESLMSKIEIAKNNNSQDQTKNNPKIEDDKTNLTGKYV